MKQNAYDQAAISTVVESVSVLADRREFDALSRLFADQLMLDYSSLSGQPKTTKAPLELMAEWASVLPGFDLTRHALSDMVVNVDGDTAKASASVVASHWLGEGFWQVSGSYDYELEKNSDTWLITSMTFKLSEEQGSRDIVAQAIEVAASTRPAGHKEVFAKRNKATVRRFFQLLEEENIRAFVDLFADDGEQLNPYNNGIFPAGAHGSEALYEYWSPLPARFDGMAFRIDELLATEDPNVIFVRYRGKINLKNAAGVYENYYYSTFRFNTAGEISEYVEIFDPIVAARGFGLLELLR